MTNLEVKRYENYYHNGIQYLFLHVNILHMVFVSKGRPKNLHCTGYPCMTLASILLLSQFLGWERIDIWVSAGNHNSYLKSGTEWKLYSCLLSQEKHQNHYLHYLNIGIMIKLAVKGWYIPCPALCATNWYLTLKANDSKHMFFSSLL